MSSLLPFASSFGGTNTSNNNAIGHSTKGNSKQREESLKLRLVKYHLPRLVLIAAVAIALYLLLVIVLYRPIKPRELSATELHGGSQNMARLSAVAGSLSNNNNNENNNNDNNILNNNDGSDDILVKSKLPLYFKRFSSTNNLQHLLEDYAAFHSEQLTLFKQQCGGTATSGQSSANRDFDLEKFSSKFLVFQPWETSGLANVVIGLTSSFLLSLLSGRVFLVNWKGHYSYVLFVWLFCLVLFFCLLFCLNFFELF